MGKKIEFDLGTKTAMSDEAGTRNLEALMHWARKKDVESQHVRAAFGVVTNQNIQLLAAVETLVAMLIESKNLDPEAFAERREAFLKEFVEAQTAKQEELDKQEPTNKIWVPKGGIQTV